MARHTDFNHLDQPRNEAGQFARDACPVDFAEVYVRLGWEAIADHYGMHWRKVARCIDECGREMLKERRAQYVREHRQRRVNYVTGKRFPPADDGISTNPAIVAAAAAYLRIQRHGGWMVSATGQGDWRVGSIRKTPFQLIEMATAKGFDAAAVTLKPEGGIS